jgi:hypothetical protein
VLRMKLDLGPTLRAGLFLSTLGAFAPQRFR